jgi:hypothetical protein
MAPVRGYVRVSSTSRTEMPSLSGRSGVQTSEYCWPTPSSRMTTKPGTDSLSVPGLVGSFPDDHDKLRRLYAVCPEINGIPSHLVYGRDSVHIVWRHAVGSALNESLPVDSTDRTRVLLRLDGAIHNDDVSADLALLAVERAVPIRRFFAWPGKRNYEGLWWSSTVRAHVPFESLLEREYLMWADFDPDIVAILRCRPPRLSADWIAFKLR